MIPARLLDRYPAHYCYDRLLDCSTGEWDDGPVQGPLAGATETFLGSVDSKDHSKTGASCSGRFSLPTRGRAGAPVLSPQAAALLAWRHR
jgi:hypothetical protein